MLDTNNGAQQAGGWVADEHRGKRPQGQQYQVLGFTFALLGLVLLLITANRAAGLTFLIVGIAFFLRGRTGGSHRRSGSERE